MTKPPIARLLASLIALCIVGQQMLPVSLYAGADRKSRETSSPQLYCYFSPDGTEITCVGIPRSATSNSPDFPPEKDDLHFVAMSGGDLGRYLYRDQLADGKLKFNIPIGRYFSSYFDPQFNNGMSAIDADGFLNPTTRQKLIDKGLLPAKAELKLEVFDVDDKATSCSEVDQVYINGKPVGRLTGKDTNWNTWTVKVPIEYLKFPITLERDMPPKPVDQQIAIDVDSACKDTWALMVDWGAIQIDAPIRPVVVVHGWTGGIRDMTLLAKRLQADGIPAGDPKDFSRGVIPIASMAAQVIQEIKLVASQFGVSKVNVFAHSKGGLVSRRAILTGAAPYVDYLTTFSSPHHGLPWAAAFQLRETADLGCRFRLGNDDLVAIENCILNTRELTPGRVREDFNYSGCIYVGPAWLPQSARDVAPSANWIDGSCKPKYSYPIGAEHYHSVVGGVTIPSANDVPEIVDLYSASYPWNVFANDRPYPTLSSVNGYYPDLGHSFIHDDVRPYHCALSFIAPKIGQATDCAKPPSVASLAPEANSIVWPRPTDQTLATSTAEVAAGAMFSQSFYTQADSSATVALLTDHEISASLKAPDGQVLISGTAGLSYVSYPGIMGQPGGWTTLLQVANPQTGTWQVAAAAINPISATSFVIFTNVSSTLSLGYQIDKVVYRPGEAVKLIARLAQNGSPVAGATPDGYSAG